MAHRQDSQNLDAAIGEALSLSREDAIARLNQLIVRYPKITPPLVEKMKLVLMGSDWDQAIDMANRILAMEPNCVPALQVNVARLGRFRWFSDDCDRFLSGFLQMCILHEICVKGNYNVVNDTERLMAEMIRQEPRSWSLHVEFGTLLARVCGHTTSVLRQSIGFVKEALKLNPESIPVNLELAYQYLLCKHYQDAVAVYKKVAKLDNSVTEALIGLTKCRLEMDSKEVVSIVYCKTRPPNK